MHYYFGTKKFAVFPDIERSRWLTLDTLTDTEPFLTLATQHDLDAFFFAHQVHGTQGIIADAKSVISRAFSVDGDWIITNKPGLGIGVLTADCVPILVFDPVHNVVAAIHAGWKGAVDGVVMDALSTLMQHYDSESTELQIFIGPHAHSCCYKVDEPFYDIVQAKQFGRNAFKMMDNQLFFDLYACCVEQFHAIGVTDTQIQYSNICTICDPVYFSYRREGTTAGRNISFIAL